MITLTVAESFDSAHLLVGYEGKCSNIHGHTWKVEVEFKSTTSDKDNVGLLVDFRDLKKIVKNVCDEFDHALLVNVKTEEGRWLADTLGRYKMIKLSVNPTVENLVEIIGYKIQNELRMLGIPMRVYRITIWETLDNSCTLYC